MKNEFSTPQLYIATGHPPWMVDPERLLYILYLVPVDICIYSLCCTFGSSSNFTCNLRLALIHNLEAEHLLFPTYSTFHTFNEKPPVGI